MTETDQKRQTVKGLLLATRPKTLAAGICPVVLAGALAWDAGVFHGGAWLACLLGAMAVQIGTNYANDYFDFVKGTDRADRIGPKRATQSGMVSPRTMCWAFVLTYAIAGLCAGYLTTRGGWIIMVLYALSVACGILYTAGPLPLGYIGLGDLFAFLFFGPIAAGATFYVQDQGVSVIPILAGCAPGFFSIAMIDVNNMRDIETDRQSRKKTMAVIFGRGFARFEYVLALFGAGIIPVWLWLQTGRNPISLASLIFVVPAIYVVRIVLTRTDGPSLNRALALTGALLLIHSILFSIGVIL